MRFTLGSNILVRAVASPREPALRLLDIILADHTLVLPRFILDEVECVLVYPRLQARYRITANEAVRFTENVAKASYLVESGIVGPIVPSYPADDPVLYTAADARQMSYARNIRHFSSPRSAGVPRGIWHPSDDGPGRPPGIFSRSGGEA